MCCTLRTACGSCLIPTQVPTLARIGRWLPGPIFDPFFSYFLVFSSPDCDLVFFFHTTSTACSRKLIVASIKLHQSVYSPEKATTFTPDKLHQSVYAPDKAASIRVRTRKGCTSPCTHPTRLHQSLYAPEKATQVRVRTRESYINPVCAHPTRLHQSVHTRLPW
jgi:hypothetical protein